MVSFGILRRIALMPFIGSLELGIAWVHAMVIYTTYPALVLSIPKDMSAMHSSWAVLASRNSTSSWHAATLILSGFDACYRLSRYCQTVVAASCA